MCVQCYRRRIRLQQEERVRRACGNAGIDGTVNPTEVSPTKSRVISECRGPLLALLEVCSEQPHSLFDCVFFAFNRAPHDAKFFITFPAVFAGLIDIS